MTILTQIFIVSETSTSHWQCQRQQFAAPGLVHVQAPLCP